MTIQDDQLLIELGKTYTREATAVVQDVDVDKGIIEARIVPYEYEADLGGGLHEIFSPHAFASAIGNPSRCKVTDQQHNRTVNIGKAVQLRDEDDALYGALRIVDTSAGRDVLTLLREKILEELSVEFQAVKGKYDVVRRGPGDFLLRHHKATLIGVSPVGAGAYGNQARVISVRNAQRERAREQALAYLDSLNSGPKA